MRPRTVLCSKARSAILLNKCSKGEARSGAALFLLRDLHRSLSEVEGLFTVLICIPCLEVRQARPDTLLGLHDPGDRWLKWGCPIEGCGQWFLGPWYLEWHTAAEHPGWTATYELLRPYPNQRMRVVYRQLT